MMETLPSYQRPEPKIVGSASTEKKAEIGNKIQENFSDNRAQLRKLAVEKLKTLEYPKRDFEKAAIKDMNIVLNDILIEVGVEPFDVSEDNIYIVPNSIYQEMYGEETDSSGHADHRSQYVAINAEETDHPYSRISTTLHEMIHLKGFVSLEATEDSDNLRRVGLQSHSSIVKSKEAKKEFRHFTGLNEAVVAELQKRLTPTLIARNPFLKDEGVESVSAENKALVKGIAEKRKLPEDEVFAARQTGPESNEYFTYSYRKQREVLDYILDSIQQFSPETFPSKDDVFLLFLQGHFKGDLLPMARAIKATFGVDALRVIGMMSAKDDESCQQVLEYLKRHGGHKRKKTP